MYITNFNAAPLQVALLILLWASAIVSAFVDNIPYTAGAPRRTFPPIYA